MRICKKTVLFLAIILTLNLFNITAFAAAPALIRNWLEARNVSAFGAATADEAVFENGDLKISPDFANVSASWGAWMAPYGGSWDVTDISSDVYTGLLRLEISVEDKSALENYYVTLASLYKWDLASGQHFYGVKLADYYDSEKMGEVQKLVIPFEDFLPQPDAFSKNSDGKIQPLDFRQIWYCGIAWDGETASAVPASDSVSIREMTFFNISAPINLKRTDNKISWTKSTTTDITEYQIFKNGEYLTSVAKNISSYTDDAYTEGDIYAVRAYHGTYDLYSGFATGRAPGKSTQLFDYAWQYLDDKNGYTKTYYNLSTDARNESAPDKAQTGTGYEVKVEDALKLANAVRTRAWGFTIHKWAIVNQSNPVVLWVGRANNSSETGTRYIDFSENYENVCMSVNVFTDGEVSLDGYYLVLGDGADGLNAVALPLSDYTTVEATNGYTAITVPLSVFAEQTSFYKEKGNDRKLDFSKIRFAGLAWQGTSYEGKDSQYVGFGQLRFYDMGAVSGLVVKDPVSVEDAASSTTLSWPGYQYQCSYYEIYRDGEKIAEVPASAVSYKDEGLQPLETYKYKIRAVNKTLPGVSGFSAEVESTTGYIGKPGNFTATGVENELKVSLAWTAPAYGNLNMYRVYRDGEVIAETAETSYIDEENLTENKNYTYAVTAISTEGYESLKTPEITVLASKIAVPSNVSYAFERQKVKLTWDEIGNAVKYIIMCDGKQVAETETAEYTSENIETDRYYEYSVKAVNANGAVSLPSDSLWIKRNNPDEAQSIVIFDEKPADGYQNSSHMGGSVSQDKTFGFNSTASIKAGFEKGAYDVSFAGLENTNGVDFTGAMSEGGVLAFMLYPKADASDVYVSLGQDLKFNGVTCKLRTLVSLDEYINKTGNWQYVKIPLSAFPEKGSYLYNTNKNYSDVDFGKITEIGFVRYSADKTDDALVYADDIRLITYKAPAVKTALLTDGTSFGNEDVISASNNSMEFTFSYPMAEVGDISLSCGEEDVAIYKTFNKKENKLKIVVPEGLKPNAVYSIFADNMVSQNGMILNGYSLNFATNSDETKPVENISENLVITSENASYGETFKADICLENLIISELSDIKLTVKYDSEILRVSEVKLADEIKNATVKTSSDGEIIIETQAESKTVLEENVAEIEFAAIDGGDAEIFAYGTFKADGISCGFANAKKTVSVAKSSGSLGGGSGSSGGGGGFAGGRGSSVSGGTAIAPITSVTPNPTISDIDSVPWAAESIRYLIENGTVNGYEDGTFRPLDNIKREEFVKLVVKAFSLEKDGATCNFSDVSETDWFYNEVAIASALGIIGGMGDGSFGSGKFITREEMCVIICRIIDLKNISIASADTAADFADETEISDWAINGVKRLVSYGIVNGTGDNMMSPKISVNRAMAAVVIAKTVKGE